MSQTIGEQLKQAREKRGLTLEQAAQETHIRVHFLEALENDRREALPSTVQGRGFLRLYAGLLDLPAAPLLAAWDGRAEAVETPVQETALPNSAVPAVVLPVLQDDLTSDEETNQTPVEIPGSLPSGNAEVYEVEDAPDLGEQTSGAIFAEIGQKLRQQREGLGLSLAEVERYTRLRLHYIKALEAGNLNDLPSPVQGRGMLSNYASFLNMDEQRLLLRFAEGLQARRIERQPKLEAQGMFSQKKRPARQAPLWRRFLTPDLMFGVGVAVIILSFALWTASRINALRTAEEEPTPPGVAEILLTPDDLTPAAGTFAPGTLAAGTLAAGTPAAGTPSPDSGTPAPTDGTAQAIDVDTTAGPQSGEEPVVGIPVVDLPPPTSTPEGTPTLPPMNNDPLQVYIIARQRAYLKVTTDNNVRFLGRTVPGNAYAFSGSRRIEISTGNSAALQVYFNQTDLGTLGLTGEVTNLVFTSEGYATPTAAFTSTPTATRLASLTPLPTETPTATPTITPFIP